MKAAINSCTWAGYAKHRNVPFAAETFFREAAEAGYAGVEVGGGEAVLGTPSACRNLARQYGLELAAYGSGITYNPWPPNTRQYRDDIRYAARLGVPLLMVCGGFMPSPRRNTYGFDYDMFAGNLGAMVEAAARRDITVAFHPHRGCIVETVKEAGELVKRLPAVRFCPDFAHLEASGEDALRFLSRFGSRCVYTHVKDYRWDQNTFTELGKGKSKLSVAECVASLRTRGYDGWLCVELDKKFAGEAPRTPLESARISRAYLRKFCGV